MPEDTGCLELNERKIIADEDVRRLILGESGTSIISDFTALSKERKKEIVSDVMKKIGAGPRQMSRVTGLPYSIIYKLNK